MKAEFRRTILVTTIQVSCPKERKMSHTVMKQDSQVHSEAVPEANRDNNNYRNYRCDRSSISQSNFMLYFSLSDS